MGVPTGPRPAPPVGTAKVVLNGTNFSHSWNNIFYVTLAGSSIDSTDLDTLASTIATSWGTNIAPHLSDSVTLTNVQIVYLPSAGTEVLGTWGGSKPGTRTAQQLQDASGAYVMSWKIGAYYRGGHPRWYVPGVATSDITNGSDVSGTAQGAFATAFAALRGAINSATTTHISSVTMGTVSFQTGNAWRSPPIFRAFGSVALSKKLGNQRRRIHS